MCLAGDIEAELEEALQPGRFIAYNASFDFVQELEEVHTRLKAMIGAGEGAPAAVHLETFIAACFEKVEEIDDSGESLGQVVEDLFCTWVRARQAAEAHSAETVGLLVKIRELDRLVTRISAATATDLEAISEHSCEAAADLLATSHPEPAACLYRAIGLGIVNAKRSRSYDSALIQLERARDCYLAAGRTDLWEDLVADIRQRHRRKTSFMPGFERVAAGGPALEREPSILERAKSRWPKLGGE